jgi:hypothetical protein
MKPFIVSLLLTCCALVWAGDQTMPRPPHTRPDIPRPNCGFIADEKVATDVARMLLRWVMTPEELGHKTSYRATLENGIWTVTIGEPKLRMHEVITIKLRQQTGALMEYKDPNV